MSAAEPPRLPPIDIESTVSDPGAPYDGRAAGYDALVGSRLYNRLIWRAEPSDYVDFARSAVGSASGPLLDVAAGTALFTADAYRDSDRSVVLTDRSRDMLARAAERIAAGGPLRPGVRFVQADAFDLPFEPGIFDTVLAQGFLHLLDDPADLIGRLLPLLRPGGRLFASSLVLTSGFASAYLRLLHRAGEVATPRSADELADLIGVPVRRHGSMAYVELVRKR